MKIGIQTYGSRGDINPWIALGQALARSGNQVILYYTNYTGGDFSHYSENNLQVISTRKLNPTSDAYERVVVKKIYDLDIESLTDYMVKEVFDLFENEMILAGEHLCADNDVLINNPNLYHTSCLAEKYQVPRINILVECQFSPSNRVSQYRDEHINSYFLDRINDYRYSINLPPVHNIRAEVFNSSWLNLLAYSRVFATDENTWGDNYKLCGYFNLDNGQSFELPKSLLVFLEQGPAPMFFSMGSLAFFEGRQFDILAIFLEAIALSGCRAIIQADWDNIEYVNPNNPDIFLIDYIPHEKILPKCFGVVHHGGAGTSHAALLSECPSIVIAYAWDQFYWGKELVRMGASAGILKRKYLEPVQLAGAIRSLIRDPEYKQNMLTIRRNIKREKGPEKAVGYIQAVTNKLVLNAQT